MELNSSNMTDISGRKKRTPLSASSRICATGKILVFKHVFFLPQERRRLQFYLTRSFSRPTRLRQNCHGKITISKLTYRKMYSGDSRRTFTKLSCDLEIKTRTPRLDLQSSLQFGCTLMSFWAYALPQLSAGEQGHLIRDATFLLPVLKSTFLRLFFTL